MATILTPGFLRWDGTKYILDPDVEGSVGPTIVNSGTGVLPDITSDESGVPAAVIAFIGSTAITVTGIKDGVESREIKVFNTNSNATLTLAHLSSTSLARNQIITPGGVDYVLQYQEGVVLIYSNIESKWRVIDKNIVAGGGTADPGGADTKIQFNDNGALGGISNWSATDGVNGVHIDYHVMTGFPALEYNGNEITRLFGSWVDDGFKVGDVFSIRGEWFDNTNNPQPFLDIVNSTVTAVTPTVITITNTISPAGYALSGEAFAQGGGFLTGGDLAGQLPDSGIIRLPTADSFVNTEVITMRDSSGDTIPLISYSSNELMIGGTFNESNQAAGVVDRRPSNIGIWGEFQIDFTDERVWRDDKGSFTNYLSEIRATVTTTNATPTILLNDTVSSLHSSYAFIELFVVANKSFPQDQGATWRFFGSKASTTFDWRTATYHANTAGAASWTCVVTGDATITVTGQAGTSIKWKVYGRYI